MTRSLLSCIFLLSSLFLFAQNPTPTVVVDNSLSGQYNEILKKSNTMQNFKIVRIDRLSGIYQSFMDTLNKERAQLQHAKTKIEVQSKTIDQLNKNITLNNKILEKANAKVNEMSFLGIQVSKGSYQLIMWGLIVILAASLAFIILKSSANRKEASYRIKLFEDLSEEFQSYKAKAINKEKKLARELQTERNNLEEINQKLR